MGVRTLLRPPRDPSTQPVSDDRLLSAYASTFALTITNPITLLAFAAIFAKVGVDQGGAVLAVAVLVGGVFTGSLVWWLGLSFGLAWIGRIAGNFHLVWINRISGGILAASGAGLLGTALKALAGI